jgi:NUMOD1 domain
LKDLILKYLHPQMYYKLHILNENPSDNPINVDKTLIHLKNEKNMKEKSKSLAHAVKVELFDTKLNSSTSYDTVSEASRAIGCSDNLIRYHLKQQAQGKNKVLIKGRYFANPISK